MNAFIVKLHFSSPVHFGNGRLSDSECTCAADTIFSALFFEALSHGKSNELLAKAKSGDLQISDSFPWIGEKYYLPKPRLLRHDDVSDVKNSNSVLKKAFKQLKYVPWSDFSSFAEGTLDPVPIVYELDHKLGKSGLVTKVMLPESNRSESNRPENNSSDGSKTDLESSPGYSSVYKGIDPEPYQVGSFSFFENAGIYFLAKGEIELIDCLLNTLQYSGLGGRRSSGYGRFTYEIIHDHKLEWPQIPTAGSMLLSSAAPSVDELSEKLLVGSAYSLIRRQGFVQTFSSKQGLTKKRDFFTFASGSVFENRFCGDVFDVSQACDHPVWRYARAFWMEGK